MKNSVHTTDTQGAQIGRFSVAIFGKKICPCRASNNTMASEGVFLVFTGVLIILSIFCVLFLIGYALFCSRSTQKPSRLISFILYSCPVIIGVSVSAFFLVLPTVMEGKLNGIVKEKNITVTSDVCTRTAHTTHNAQHVYHTHARTNLKYAHSHTHIPHMCNKHCANSAQQLHPHVQAIALHNSLDCVVDFHADSLLWNRDLTQWADRVSEREQRKEERSRGEWKAE